MSTPATRLAVLDSTSLKLHTAPNGHVWFADGTRAPVGSGMSVSQFVDTLKERRQPFLRILGAMENVPLIVAVWPLCRIDGKLQVASPSICENEVERKNAEIALYRSRQVCLPPSSGGWHDFTTADFTTYALAARIARDQKVTGSALELIRYHPAWPALQFIRGISDHWVAWVLAIMLDPRWFVNPARPDRIGRLRSFLGLRPATYRVLARDAAAPGTAAARARAVRGAWKNRPPHGAEWDIPGNFLWRIWRNAGRGAKGDLKASQKFLVFLRYTWLDALPRTTTSGSPDPLFLPNMLLRGSREIEAFEHHIAQYQNRV